MDAISRKDAKALGLRHYWTGRPCSRGHIDKRQVTSFGCMTCLRENSQTWFDSLSVVSREKRREYERTRWKDPKHRARQLADQRTPRVKKLKSEINRRWKSQNRDRCTAQENKRRAAQLQAMPAWVDLAAIKVFYEEAARMTRETGVQHDVDHIVPLQGKSVCGLHVAWNLQVMPHVDNVRKSNRLQVSEAAA